MGRTVCTEPQCLYSRAIPLHPLWAVRSLQSLSACTRVHFIFTLLRESEYWLISHKNSCIFRRFLLSYRWTWLETNTRHYPIRVYLMLTTNCTSQSVSFDALQKLQNLLCNSTRLISHILNPAVRNKVTSLFTTWPSNIRNKSGGKSSK
jgi:hypothetical protein